MASQQSRTTSTVFVDSSVLFSAAYSVTGSAHDLISAAIQGHVQVALSDLVLEETERNLERSAPAAVPAFHRLQQALSPLVVHPESTMIAEAETVVATKDAPIV